MFEHKKPWNPLSIEELASVFADADFPWWIAGGIALELALGKVIRTHGDIDVLLLRKDHLCAQQLLAKWDCWVADPPGTLRPWINEETLPHGIHDIWCRRLPDDDWRFQLMIDESDEHDWFSRKNAQVRLSLSSITWKSSGGIPYLAPHIMFYYKAKNPEGKHQVDFDAIIDSHVVMDRRWLKDAISLSYGESHPWLRQLSGS